MCIHVHTKMSTCQSVCCNKHLGACLRYLRVSVCARPDDAHQEQKSNIKKKSMNFLEVSMTSSHTHPSKGTAYGGFRF